MVPKKQAGAARGVFIGIKRIHFESRKGLTTIWADPPKSPGTLGCPPKTLVTEDGVVEMGLVAGYPALGHASIGILGGSA